MLFLGRISLETVFEAQNIVTIYMMLHNGKYMAYLGHLSRVKIKAHHFCLWQLLFSILPSSCWWLYIQPPWVSQPYAASVCGACPCYFHFMWAALSFLKLVKILFLIKIGNPMLDFWKINLPLFLQAQNRMWGRRRLGDGDKETGKKNVLIS